MPTRGMLGMFSFKSIQCYTSLRQAIKNRVADPDLAQRDESLCQARMVM